MSKVTAMHRHRTITTKVQTPFASLYTHVSFDNEGHAIEVSISSPGKFSETEMGEALTALAEAITNALKNDLLQVQELMNHTGELLETKDED